MSNSNGETKPEPLDADLLRQFMENQALDLQNRSQEQENKRIELTNTHAYSLKLLDAQLTDRQREREHSKGAMNSVGCILVFVSLFIVAGICYALYLNKDQLVIEIVKAIVYIITGGIGGYSIKAVRSKKDEHKD